MINIKKLIERLLMFFIGLPLVVALVLYLPWKNNLVMNIVAIFLSGVGALELSFMLKKKNIFISKIESILLGAAAPIAVTIFVSFLHPKYEWIIFAVIMSGAGWALMSGVFSGKKDLESGINKVAGSFTLLIYPGLFMYWLIRMNLWGNSYAILLFLLIVITSDSSAWLLGILFGKNNRGIIAASPNKSIAGFIGGILGPVGISVFMVFFLPRSFYLEIFNSSFLPINASLSLIVSAIILGFFTGLAAILGDLSESVIKRSCNFKDS